MSDGPRSIDIQEDTIRIEHEAPSNYVTTTGGLIEYLQRFDSESSVLLGKSTAKNVTLIPVVNVASSGDAVGLGVEFLFVLENNCTCMMDEIMKD